MSAWNLNRLKIWPTISNLKKRFTSQRDHPTHNPHEHREPNILDVLHDERWRYKDPTADQYSHYETKTLQETNALLQLADRSGYGAADTAYTPWSRHLSMMYVVVVVVVVVFVVERDVQVVVALCQGVAKEWSFLRWKIWSPFLPFFFFWIGSVETSIHVLHCVRYFVSIHRTLDFQRNGRMFFLLRIDFPKIMVYDPYY